MSNQRADVSSSSVLDPIGSMRPDNAANSSVGAVAGKSMIGKSLVIKGDITGTESIHVEGTVEGSIMLPGDRVTVRSSGRVSADITAQDIVVMGELVGNCEASGHLDVRREGSICGNVLAARISVEDGAYLTGTIDIRRDATPARRVEKQETEDQELGELAHTNWILISKETGHSIIFAVNTKSEAVVQSAEAYQRLPDIAALADEREGVH